jgi:hypothetical protein
MLIGAASFAGDLCSVGPDSIRLIPKSRAVGKWMVVPMTFVYAKGNDLQKIYAGSYQLYTRNGVVDAAQEFYSCGNDTATVTIHSMTSRQAAAAFYDYWKTQDTRNPCVQLLNIPASAYVYTSAGTANACMYNDKYFVTVSINVDGARGRTAASEFLRSISVSISRPVTPRK